MVGKFNVGKSFIIKLLSEVYVKTGDTLHTIGIEFYKAKGDILFLAKLNSGLKTICK